MFNAIIMPIAQVLGYIFNLLFEALSFLHIGNVAIAIILFTIIVKLCMLPLSIKQQKLAKLNSVMSPEIKAINEKYKDKKNDQNAMMKMQEETKAVYEKYGVSQMGGCVQMLIQMPILLALYQVFRFIPLYITQLKNLFTAFLTDNGGIMSASGYTDTMKQFGENIDWTNVNTAITEINKFSTENWEALRNAFPAFSDIIANSHASLEQMNTFLGINMSQEPGFGLTLAFLIPVLSGLSQFISVKVAQGNTPVDDDNPMAASMRMTTYIFPLMSAFIAISVPAGLGLYWIATSVIQTIITVFINRYYDKLGAETIVKKNVEKRNKKRAKKGLPPETIAKNATVSTKNVNREKAVKSLEQIKAENEKKVKEIKESAQYYKTAKPGSLAEKAGMVAKYNEKSSKNGTRKN
ncbi:MAG TPA: preprotein translocase YidC [Eubacterium sp.]|uniref:YidC/Oxa1 family membrane protein insertase n=1 Tax=Lachnospira sp. TaxID=2049031 RepID=UPI000E9B4079|nr:preprotein translocase YidC [Eubacterium sp.]